MVYNVLHEKCVPVRLRETGEFCNLGIREVFARATEIESVFTTSPFEEYGVKRMLLALFMDIYLPRTDDELVDVYEKGHFDMNKFDAYIQDIGEERFDLFSKETPFYQSKFDANYDYIVKSTTKNKVTTKTNVPIVDGVDSISGLFHDLASGTKHTFFMQDCKVKPRDCFRGLCGLSLFVLGKGGEGVPPCIDGGDSPYYFWLRGNNIFQELIINSISQEDWESTVSGKVYSYTGGKAEPVIWRRSVDRPIRKGNNFGEISLLQGLTYVSKRLRLSEPNKDGFVETMLLSSGSKFLNEGNYWNDPHCVYVVHPTKGVSVPLRAVEDDNILSWLSLGAFYGEDGTLMTLRKFGLSSCSSKVRSSIKRKMSKFGLDEINIVYYVTLTHRSGGIHRWWKREDYIVDLDLLLGDSSLIHYYKGYLSLVKNIGKKIKTTPYSAITVDITDYYVAMKDYLFDTYLPKIKELVLQENINFNEELAVLHSDLKKVIISTVSEVYTDYFIRQEAGSSRVSSISDKDRLVANSPLILREKDKHRTIAKVTAILKKELKV